MNSNDKARLFLAIAMLFVTVGWALFTVNATTIAMANKLTGDIIGAAGANNLLGVFGTLTILCWQFYFRKAPETKT